MRNSHLAPFPSAILGLALIFVLSGVATIPNGWQRKVPTKGTSEPLSWFPECWVWQWSWCPRSVEDPKWLAPDVPAGCCSDTCVGPCQ